MKDTVEHDVVIPPSLDCVNDDCLLLILSYMPADVLNSVAICSKRWCAAPAHETLDLVSAGSTIDSVVDSIINNEWNNVCQGRRTKLEVMGLGRLKKTATAPSEKLDRGKLIGVTSLVLKCSPKAHRQYVRREYMVPFSILFPNLRRSQCVLHDVFCFRHLLLCLLS